MNIDNKQDKNFIGDWTNYYDQNEVAEKSALLVDKILLEIYENKLESHKNLELSIFEVSLLYHWLVYNGVNLFIERLLRVKTVRDEIGKCDFPKANYLDHYFENSNESILASYYDFSINYKLLNDLAEILKCSLSGREIISKTFPKPQESLLPGVNRGIVKNTLRLVFFFLEKKYIKIFKPEIIGEHSNWFRKMYFFGRSIDFTNHVFGVNNYTIDTKTREKLKNIFEDIFVLSIPDIVGKLPNHQIKLLSKAFSRYLDQILPFNILEGLQERFYYYQNILSDWSVKEVHAFTGFIYNDNFKIFSVIAKRKGAKLVGHAHGANNYFLGYRSESMLRFMDYFTTYGIVQIDSFLEAPGARRVKFIPTGSTAFQAVPKWQKSSIKKENFILFYPSGPLMDFATDLQEISTEKNLGHRSKILLFLDHILQRYSGLVIYYKPFPGTFTNDPIKIKLSKWFEQGRIKLTGKIPQKLFPKVDIVFWDSISTGFAESIVSGVPVIVFNSENEYNQVSSRGRVVNDALIDSGVQCFDIDVAEKSIMRILNDLPSYKKGTAKSIQMFIEDYATPVNKKEWHMNFRKGLEKVDYV